MAAASLFDKTKKPTAERRWVDKFLVNESKTNRRAAK
jgi:hypothetical protein